MVLLSWHEVTKLALKIFVRLHVLDLFLVVSSWKSYGYLRKLLCLKLLFCYEKYIIGIMKLWPFVADVLTCYCHSRLKWFLVKLITSLVDLPLVVSSWKSYHCFRKLLCLKLLFIFLCVSKYKDNCITSIMKISAFITVVDFSNLLLSLSSEMGSCFLDNFSGLRLL